MKIGDLEVLGLTQMALEPEATMLLHLLEETRQTIMKHSQTTPTQSLEQGLYEDPFGYGLQISMPHLWIDPTKLGAVKHDRGLVVTDVFRTLTIFFLCPMVHWRSQSEALIR
jgi:hypothetical protein